MPKQRAQLAATCPMHTPASNELSLDYPFRRNLHWLMYARASKACPSTLACVVVVLLCAWSDRSGCMQHFGKSLGSGSRAWLSPIARPRGPHLSISDPYPSRNSRSPWTQPPLPFVDLRWSCVALHHTDSADLPPSAPLSGGGPCGLPTSGPHLFTPLTLHGGGPPERRLI